MCREHVEHRLTNTALADPRDSTDREVMIGRREWLYDGWYRLPGNEPIFRSVKLWTTTHIWRRCTVTVFRARKIDGLRLGRRIHHTAVAASRLLRSAPAK